MKIRNVMVTALAAAMTLSLAACGSTNTEESSSSTQAVMASSGTDTSSVSTAASATSGSTAETTDDKSHLNVVPFMWMDGLDPSVDWDGWTVMRCGIGETLLTIDENMQLKEQLADSWEQEDDTTYRFHIRKGVKFSNGNDMTPQTVVDSIKKVAESNSRGGNLKLASAEVDGEDVVFKTTEPYSSFPYMLTEPMCIIVDTTVDMSNYANDPICTGPYEVTEYVPEERIELAANENYWNGVSEIKTISVLNVSDDTKVDSMLSGDLDVAGAPTPTTLSQVEGNSDIDMVQVMGTRESDIELNCREGHPTADKNLRLALSCAIDRDVIAQIAGNGYSQPLTTAFPSSVGYDSDQVDGQKYDLDAAKKYLAAAGYEDTDGNGFVDKDGTELNLTFSLSSSANTAVYEAIQDMWKQIGVNSNIALLENTKDIRDSGDFDIISGGWQTVNNGDGESYLTNRWSDGGTDNYSGFHSDEFQSVLDEVHQAFDKDARIAAFVKAQQVLADESPSIFLYANNNITLVNNKKVKNVTVYPIDYYFIDANWKLAD